MTIYHPVKAPRKRKPNAKYSANYNPVKRRHSYEKNHARERAYMSERTRKFRLQLFEVMGGAKCVRCGFIDIRALQFDHINGNGRKNRKQLKGSLGMYQYYATHPEEARADLQILCANCNWIKKFEREEIRPHWRREEFEQKKNEVNLLTFIPSTV